MENEKKDTSSIAIVIGFVLIIFVGALTFFRPVLFSGKNKEVQTEQSKIDPQKKGVGISPEALWEKINQPRIETKKKNELVIIDIRDPDSFLREHLADSKNIPASELPGRLNSLEKNGDYVIVDDSGSENISTLTSEFFLKKDFASVAYLSGGISAWKNKLYPLINDGDPASFSDQSKVLYIKTEDLKKMFLEKEDFLLVDLRKSNAFSEGHIPGSINIPLDDLEKRRSELALGKKIVLCDNDGLWAFKGAVRLFDLGVFNVFTLSDGLNEWKKKGYEVTK